MHTSTTTTASDMSRAHLPFTSLPHFAQAIKQETLHFHQIPALCVCVCLCASVGVWLPSMTPSAPPPLISAVHTRRSVPSGRTRRSFHNVTPWWLFICVPNLRPGFAVEYIWLPGSRAGICKNTRWPPRRQHRRKNEAGEITKLADGWNTKIAADKVSTFVWIWEAARSEFSVRQKEKLKSERHLKAKQLGMNGKVNVPWTISQAD